MLSLTKIQATEIGKRFSGMFTFGKLISKAPTRFLTIAFRHLEIWQLQREMSNNRRELKLELPSILLHPPLDGAGKKQPLWVFCNYHYPDSLAFLTISWSCHCFFLLFLLLNKNVRQDSIIGPLIVSHYSIFLEHLCAN